MARYIDADKLMKSMYHRAFETDGDTMWQSGCWVRYRAIEQVVKEQPTADVVEVIMCKDCKWFNDIGCAINIIDDCDKPSENDFCSFAERRTDEAD